MQCESRSKTHAHVTQSNAVHYDGIHYKEPIDPQESRELRDPKDGEPKERFRGTQAGDRKCHRVSFANKRRDERGTNRKEGRGNSEDTAGRSDERRLGQGRMEGGGTGEGKVGGGIAYRPQSISVRSSHGSCPPGSATYGPREKAGFTWRPHDDSGTSLTRIVPPRELHLLGRESQFAWHPSAHFGSSSHP